ncbi:InlB B-repeat-containing protein, partial [Candidatus Magnetominusculus xianensis]|uniref:RCC1 domain-containing protein n=1 Tax=Candidatus Magnetominusculus xianensis TaxID=1748249 RepID=UPI000A120AD0
MSGIVQSRQQVNMYILSLVGIVFLLLLQTNVFAGTSAYVPNGNKGSVSAKNTSSNAVTAKRTATAGSSQNPFLSIVAGELHSMALKNDGTVWAWGSNLHGQLGNDQFGVAQNTSTADSTIPVQVSGLTGVTAIAAGTVHSLALKSDGTVWAWGYNHWGQLGNGTYGVGTNTDTPVQVSGLTGVIAIAGGTYHSLALRGDGTVWAWGLNGSGELGNGTIGEYESRKVPEQVSGLSGVIAIAGGQGISMALKSDGTVWAWGENSYGQLGNGTNTNYETTPVQVSGLSGVIAINSAFGETFLALKSDGTVWVWGWNGGRYGDGTTITRNTPVQVHGANNVGYLTGVIAISTGYTSSSMVLKSDGTVWTWGMNNYGQLGDGTTMNRNTPVQVHGANNVGYLTGVIAISTGREQSMVLKNDGTVWTWGWNYSGKLGDGTTIDRHTPVQVLFPATVTVTPSAGTGGTISPSTPQSVVSGGTKQFTVTPNTGYTASVTGCGGTLSGNTYTTGAVAADCSVTATFTPITYTVTPSAGANGSISPSTPQTVVSGGTKQFTITPNTGYTASVGGTCSGSLVGNTYTTMSITNNCTVVVTFSQTTYTVTPSAGTGGTISCTPTSVSSGGSSTCTITPNSGYGLASLTDNNEDVLSQVAGNNYIISNVTGNHSIAAIFSVNIYTVTGASNGNGT